MNAAISPRRLPALSPSAPVRVGSRAPEFRVVGPELQVMSSVSFRGRPFVLAFLPNWTAGGAPCDEVAAIRAELRGLGAVLVVFSDSGIWSLRPDDDIELFAARCDVVAHEVARVARLYGVATALGGVAPSIFLIDAQGDVRFAHAARTRAEDLRSGLASALAAAGRTLAAHSSRRRITMTRREWVMSSLVAGFVLAFSDGCGSGPEAGGAPSKVPAGGTSGEIDLVLRVNGVERTVRVEPRVTLLDALRERMGLTGTKKGCDHGQCGACTVLVDGRRINACLTLAVMVEGKEITTIEGLARGDDLHPVQAAFLAEDGFQCGYCTPGQIMSAVGLLAEGRAGSDDEIREQMSGNLCRCGAYPNIVAAIRRAQKGA